MYYIVFAIWRLFSLLPMGGNYLISDALYLFIYKIVGYRTAVACRNHSSSFPNMSEEELRNIECVRITNGSSATLIGEDI